MITQIPNHPKCLVRGRLHIYSFVYWIYFCPFCWILFSVYPQCLLFVASICQKCHPWVLSGEKKMSQLRRRTVIQSGRTAGTNKASKGTLSRVLLSKQNYVVHLCYIILYLYYTVCLHSYCITSCCNVCKFFGLLS